MNLLLDLACLTVRRFGSAVRLIRFCEPLVGPELGLDPPEWIGIAARDAALSLYHFSVTLQSIRSGMKDCPTLLASVDSIKLRNACKQFKQEFPDAELLRHAVGHLGDQLSTPESIGALRRPGEFLMWETQVGTHFTMASPAGRQVGLDVDEQTEERLKLTLTQVCDAFAGANPTWLPYVSDN